MKKTDKQFSYSNPKIWICDLTYTQQTVASDTIPMAIGCLATYTEKKLPWLNPIKIFKYPQKLCDTIEKEGFPEVMCFANYVWNFKLSYEFVKLIKKKSPNTVIVFGGPNYPVVEKEQNDWLKQNSLIDFYIVKEGEIPFVKLIEELVAKKFQLEDVKKSKVPSAHCALEDGTVILTSPAERIKHLSEIPSPYLDGRLDEFFDGTLMPLVQTNRGCPFTCTFCVEGVGYYNKINKYCHEKISSELDYIGKKMKSIREKGGRNDLFIADSNFGMYKEDLNVARELAKTQEKYGWPNYINVATGKNVKHRILETSKIIGGALRLSGSVQSLDPQVQENIKRKNISAEGLMDLALSASEIGANSYSEIILGLPGDSKKAHFNTIKTVIEAGFNSLYLFQLMILPGSEMSTLESVKKYGMEIKHRILPRCYGNFKVKGEEVVSAEIEQICVSSNTLSYDDYLSCRSLHLIITLFYNDGIFSSLLKFFSIKKLSIWRWIEILKDLKFGKDFQEISNQFTDATRNELWENPDDLWNFVRKEGVVKKYIDGELGNNLLFTHKSMAIVRAVDDLSDLAHEAAEKILKENGINSQENINFVSECVKYHRNSIKNIFSKFNEISKSDFKYNIKSFIDDVNAKDISDYEYDIRQEIKFVLSDNQKEVILNFIKIFGASTKGISRILSRVYINKLFRSGISSEVNEAINDKLVTEKNISISGLQN